MIKLLIVLLIIGIFFLQKVEKHNARLKSPYNTIYKVYKTLFDFIHVPLRKIIKPVNIGTGLDIDLVPFVPLVILLILSLIN